MKHFYENLGEDWFSYAEFYKDMVKKCPDGGVIVEIGAWKGRSTAYMAVEIINSGKNIAFFTVDAWKYRSDTEQPVSNQKEFDKVYQEFIKNMQPVLHQVNILKMLSTHAAVLFNIESIDILFIDGSHYEKDLINDIIFWQFRVKEGGIIAGHDYFTAVHPGVKKAVNKMMPDAKFIKEQNVWYYEKKYI